MWECAFCVVYVRWCCVEYFVGSMLLLWSMTVCVCIVFMLSFIVSVVVSSGVVSMLCV